MRRIAFLMLAVSGICWGLGFPLGKVALGEMDAVSMVLLRFAVASLVAMPILAISGGWTLFRAPAVLAAGMLYGLAFLVQFEGLARVTVTMAALLVGAMPALVAVAARLLGERVSRAAWLGVAAATIGAALIAGKPGAAGSPLGVVLSLASLLLFLGWLLATKRAPLSAAPMAVTAVTVLVATATILPIALWLHGPPPLSLSAAAWAGIVGQGMLSTFVATAAWQYGAARVDSASAGVFINIEPLMGSALGVLLFGDIMTSALIAGGLLILIGSFVVVLNEAPSAEAELVHGSPPTPA